MELTMLAKVVDEFNTKRVERLAADKVAKALKKEETTLKERLVDQLREAGIGSVGGSTHRVTLQTKRKPQVADWPAMYQYIADNSAFELLQRRVGEAAINERLEDGEEMPFIEFFEVDDLSVSKL